MLLFFDNIIRVDIIFRIFKERNEEFLVTLKTMNGLNLREKAHLNGKDTICLEKVEMRVFLVKNENQNPK